MSLYIHETGNPEAPTIVFLHGIGASGWMWKPQVSALSDFHCLAVDLPGHGQSNDILWVSLNDTASQIFEIIQSHSANERAHVVGLSLGGYITLVLLDNYAQSVERAIISGVTSSPMPNRAFLRPQLWLTAVLWKQGWFAKSLARSYNLSPDMEAELVENMRAMSMAAYKAIYREAAEFEVPASLASVDVPTLIVAGGNETKIIKDAVADISQLMPNAQGLLAPGLGHGWNVQNPDWFNAMVRAWISDRPLPHELQSYP